MKFNLKRPCDNCPFRKDKIFRGLGKERVESIAKALEKEDKSFACHKTVDYDSWDHYTDDYEYNGEESFCAGALILLIKEGHPNKLPRIAAVMLGFDYKEMDMESPVFDSFEEFIEIVGKA